MKKKKIRKVALWLMEASLVSCLSMMIPYDFLKAFPAVANVAITVLFSVMIGSFGGSIVLFIVSLFVGNERNESLLKECLKESISSKMSKPKCFSQGVISANEIHLGSYRRTYKEFSETRLKRKDNQWFICFYGKDQWLVHPVGDGEYSETELSRDYFLQNNIRNIDDLLKDVLEGYLTPCREMIKKNEETVEFIDENFSSLYVEKCERCGKSCIETVKFADKKCCEECWKYYHGRFCVNNEKVIEKDTGDELLNEIVLCDREPPSYRNSRIITKFVVSIFAKLTEVQWCVGWRDEYDVVHNAEGKDNLETDYFQKHNLSDFDTFVKSKKLLDESKIWVYYCDRHFPEFLKFFKNGNRATTVFKIKIYPKNALPLNYPIDSCLKSNIKKAKIVIDIFASNGYELSNIHTVGGIDEASHLGVARYVAAYDNAADFVNNAYSDYEKSKNDAVSYEFEAFCAVFIRNGYTIITEIGLDDEICIQREKCSEEIKETIRQISVLIQKEFYNEDCIVEEFDE